MQHSSSTMSTGRFSVQEADGEWQLIDAMLPCSKAVISEEYVIPVKSLLEGKSLNLSPNDISLVAEPFARLYSKLEWFASPFYRNTIRSCFVFWQYPARTEQEAYERRLRQQRLTLVDNGVISMYVPIPFATLIDKKDCSYSSPILKSLVRFTSGYAHIFSRLRQADIRIVSTCQHIDWKKCIDFAAEAEINTLYCSHAASALEIKVSNGKKIKVLPWPLYAPNAEEEARRIGLEKKSIKDRKFLASFKGAYMDHYITDDRIKLQAISHPRILIEVTRSWHYQEVVYGQQLKGTHATIDQGITSSVLDFNALLSDSIFSICPVGAGLNTLRFWESISIGAIPVLIGNEWNPPFLDEYLHTNLQRVHGFQDFYVTIPREDMHLIPTILSGYSHSLIEQMSDSAIAYYNFSKTVLPL